MYIVGRGRYASETYPEPTGGGASALTNRYLLSGASAVNPDPFAKTPAAGYVVAAANVTRKASGLFVVSMQYAVTLAAPDTLEWAIAVLSGSVVSGGTSSGQWLVRIGSDITFSPPTASSGVGEYIDQRDAGTLSATVTMSGINLTPMLPGNGAIIVFGAAAGGTLISPSTAPTGGQLFASAYELP